MKSILGFLAVAFAALSLTSCCCDRDPCCDPCPPKPRCCEPRPCRPAPQPRCCEPMPQRCEQPRMDNCCY